MRINKNKDGFTILELMITVALLGVIITIAVPSLTRFIDNQALRASGQKLQTFLNFARGKAVSDLRNLRVCWNDTASNITKNSQIIEPGHAAIIDTSDNSLVGDIEYKDTRLTHADDENDNCFAFRPTGRANDNISWVFCKSPTDADRSQGVSVTNNGRVLLLDNDQDQLIACSTST